MTDKEKETAATLFLQQCSNITGLWGIYIAATFTGGAFTVVNVSLKYQELLAVTLGFWAFCLGHLGMVIYAQRSAKGIRAQVIAGIPEPESTLDHMVLAVTRGGGVFWSIFCHLFIDICVTIMLWRTLLF